MCIMSSMYKYKDRSCTLKMSENPNPSAWTVILKFSPWLRSQAQAQCRFSKVLVRLMSICLFVWPSKELCFFVCPASNHVTCKSTLYCTAAWSIAGLYCRKYAHLFLLLSHLRSFRLSCYSPPSPTDKNALINNGTYRLSASCMCALTRTAIHIVVCFTMLILLISYLSLLFRLVYTQQKFKTQNCTMSQKKFNAKQWLVDTRCACKDVLLLHCLSGQCDSELCPLTSCNSFMLVTKM